MPQSSSQFSSNFSSNFTSTPGLNMSKMSVTAPLTSMPSFDKNGLDPASLNGLQQAIGFVDSSLRLPDNPRAFAVYLLGLVIVFIGAFLQVLVSAQIMQAEVTLARLQEDYRVVEQQNGDLTFQIARDSNMQRLYERVLANGYVPVQKREYIFRPNEAVATAPLDSGAIESAAGATLPESAATIAQMTPATAQVSLSSNLGGQVARWEEFWNNTWRAATGSGTSFSAPGATPNTALSTVQPTQGSPNFWAVWWEQASDQGAKLLEQLRSQ